MKWTSWSVAIAFGLLTLFAATPSHAERPADAEDALPEVSIPLLGHVSEIKGMKVPQPSPHSRLLSGDLLEPHRLTLVMPDGKTIRLKVRSSSWTAQDGVIFDIYIRRPLETMKFAAVVADLRQTLKEMGIEPSGRFKECLDNMPEEFPGVDEGGSPFSLRVGRVQVVPNVASMLVDVIPDPRRGWFYLMDINPQPHLRDLILAQGRWEEQSRIFAAAPTVALSLSEPIDQIIFDTDPVRHWLHDGDIPHDKMYPSHKSIAYMDGETELFRVPVFTSEISQTDGRVIEIEFVPGWRLGPMPQVLEQLQTSLREWNVELTDELKAEFVHWGEQPAIPKDYSWTGSASAPLNKGATLHWSINPIPGWGWFVRMRISPDDVE